MKRLLCTALLLQSFFVASISAMREESFTEFNSKQVQPTVLDVKAQKLCVDERTFENAQKNSLEFSICVDNDRSGLQDDEARLNLCLKFVENMQQQHGSDHYEKIASFVTKKSMLDNINDGQRVTFKASKRGLLMFTRRYFDIAATKQTNLSILLSPSAQFNLPKKESKLTVRLEAATLTAAILTVICFLYLRYSINRKIYNLSA